MAGVVLLSAGQENNVFIEDWWICTLKVCFSPSSDVNVFCVLCQCGGCGVLSHTDLLFPQEWRHAHGMRCLGIPNTAHFANVTQIEDAVSCK